MSTANGGAAKRVKVIEASDLKANGGAYSLEGRAPVAVYGVEAAETLAEGGAYAVEGNVAVPVYVVETPAGATEGTVAPLPMIGVGDAVGAAGNVAIPVYVVGGSLSGNAPELPRNFNSFTAVPTGANRDNVLISWDASEYATGYILEYSPDNSVWTQIADTADLNFTHSPTLGIVTHYYRVKAYNIYGETGWLTATIADLLLGLVAYWTLNSDGTDSAGTNHLTTVGTITYGAGKMGNAAQFASGSHFSLPSNSTVSRGNTSYTFSVWANIVGNNKAILAKDTNTPGEREYTLFRVDGDVYWEVFRPNGTVGTVHHNDDGFTEGSWHHLIAGYNADTGMSFAIRDNATSGTASIGTAGGETAAPFTIGYRDGNNADGGAIQHVGLWNRVLSTTNQASLNNGGAGLGYPFQ